MIIDTVQCLQIWLLVKEYCPDDKTADQLATELVAILREEQPPKFD